MRKNHTLTYNETTYTINDGFTTNSIFINGVESGWYIQYDTRDIDGDIVVPHGIRLKYQHDEDTETYYLYLDTATLRFKDIVHIIMTIKNY